MSSKGNKHKSNKHSHQGKKQDTQQDNEKSKQPSTFKGLWELDEQEKALQDEHLQQLKSKYRDRAQERRQGKFEMKQEGGQFANISDSEEEDEDQLIKVKGLDYDLLRENNQQMQQQGMLAEQRKQQFLEIKNNIMKTKLVVAKRDPCQLAKNIGKTLEMKKKWIIGQFPKAFQYYKYDIQNQYTSSDLPQIIQKQRHQDQITTVIAQVSDNCIDKLGRIMKIMKTGGREKLREERLKQQQELLKQKKAEEEDIKKKKNQDNMFDISDDDDYFGNNKSQNEQKNKPISLFSEEEKAIEGNSQNQQENIDTQQIENNQEQIKKKKRNILEEVDYYEECFQNSAPSLNQLKKLKVDSQDKGHQNQKKDKKVDYDRQYQAIQKIIQDKDKQ